MYVFGLTLELNLTYPQHNLGVRFPEYEERVPLEDGPKTSTPEERVAVVNNSLQKYIDSEVLFDSDPGNILTWLILNPAWVACYGARHPFYLYLQSKLMLPFQRFFRFHASSDFLFNFDFNGNGTEFVHYVARETMSSTLPGKVSRIKLLTKSKINLIVTFKVYQTGTYSIYE